MAGRVNTALNVFVFIGMFSGQWRSGSCSTSGRRRQRATAAAYPRALGMLWLVSSRSSLALTMAMACVKRFLATLVRESAVR
jgi:hypothetical protein